MKICVDISIVIPVYNAEAFLLRCLSSLQAQTSKNIEIIFINDGSTDGSYNKLIEFESKFSNVFIFSQKNGGAGAARNVGLDRANGEYVLFLDVDDYIFPDCCRLALEAIECSQADFVCFGADFLSTSGKLVVQAPKKKYEIFDLDILRNMLTGNDIKSVVWNKIYRRDFLNKNFIRFNDSRVNEDSLFVLKAACHAACVKLIPLVLYRHNSDNPSSLSNGVDISYFKSTIDVLDSERHFLLNQNLMDSVSFEFEIHSIRLMFFLMLFSSLNMSKFNEYKICIDLFKLSEHSIVSENCNIPRKFSLGIRLRIFLIRRYKITWGLGHFLKIFGFTLF